MKYKRQTEQGFAAVEAVLIVVILVIVGFVGWYVYHAKHNADKSLNNAALQTAQNSQSKANSKPQITTLSPGTDNASLNSDLNSINSSQNQEIQDSNAANTGINDQQSQISVPTN